MQLPKRQLPSYTTTLPISGIEVTYRPYTVGEEKILMMAATSNELQDRVGAIKQVVANCSSVDINNIHPTDLEWMFIQLRKTASSSIVEINYTVEKEYCGKETSDVKSARACPTVITTAFNLNNVDITTSEMHKYGTKKSDGTWVVKIEDDLHFQLSVTSNEFDGSESVIYNMIKSIIIGDEVYTHDMFTPEEFELWVDENVSPTGIEKLSAFFDAIPKTTVNIVAKCSVCKKEFEYDLMGVSNFLM